MREDWVEVELGNALIIERGGSPRPIKEYITDSVDGINWIKIGDTQINSKYIKHTSEKIKPEGLKKTRIVKKGDLLLSNSMSFGRPYILATDGAIHDGWLVLKNATDFKIDSEYLYYVLSSPAISVQFDELAAGSTVRNLNIGLVSRVIAPIAPLPIQRAIVLKIENLFASLDKGIADLKTAHEQLKVYRQAVLKKAFEGEFTNRDVKEGELPECWKWVKLGEVGEIVTGSTPSKKISEFYDIIEFPFYKPTDLEQGINVRNSIDGVSITGFSNGRNATVGSILVTCIGATIGKTGLIKKEGVFNQQINAIVPSKDYESKYVYYQVISSSFQEQIKTNASSTTLPIINKSKFSNLGFIYCPLSEQHAVVREIESRLSVCDKVEQNINEALEKAEALRQSILKKAFKGKLLSEEEIAKCKLEADYEPASELLKKIKAEKK